MRYLYTAALVLAVGFALEATAPSTYAVDRIEGDTAILIRDEDGAVVELPVSALEAPQEGAVYRWLVTWTRDHAEESRRLEANKAALEKLIES